MHSCSHYLSWPAMATASSTAAADAERKPPDDPKYRLEHSVSSTAGCNRAACHRSGTKIAKGELRIGTLGLLVNEDKYFYQWRHWGCATKAQVKKMIVLAEENPAKVPGYEFISAESQEQVRLAFEQGDVVDRGFEDVRTDLCRSFGMASDETINAIGFKVEVTTRASAFCRSIACKALKNEKMAKGELRLGLLTVFQGDHTSWCYKHWRCATKIELNGARNSHREGELEGLSSLPEEYRNAILESFEKDEVIDPPLLEFKPPKKVKKSRKQKDLDTDLVRDLPGIHYIETPDCGVSAPYSVERSVLQDTEEDHPVSSKKAKQSRPKSVSTEEDEYEPSKKITKSRVQSVDTEEDQWEPQKRTRSSRKKTAGVGEDGAIASKKSKGKKRSADETQAEGIGELGEKSDDLNPKRKRGRR
ncbi:unnamed protein product [Periconia digitata]|uniref:PARP-type domain-containing protein n=1 Tax=Periconia digitata TaxID=1303443 RepID=A0A9W4XSP3_9PLEO|nr:unnamed protein product [Periconia digitata]